LIEVVAVLVLIGILAAVAMVRASTNDNDVMAAADQLTNHLRYLQSRSMASDSTTNTDDFYSALWGLQITANQYTAYFCADPGACGNGDAVTLPGHSGAVSAPGDASYSGDTSIYFDKFGRPHVGTAASPASSDLSVTVSDGSNTETITVFAETGYME
jgi:type II secretory pathway pseudopilin PulG